MLRYLPFLLVLAVWIYSFIDCLTTPEEKVRNLPKVAWAIVILLFGQVLVGPIAWMVAGRPRGAAAREGGPRGGGPFTGRRERRHFVAPDDNPEFLASLSKALGNAGKDAGTSGTAESAEKDEPDGKDDAGEAGPDDQRRLD